MMLRPVVVLGCCPAAGARAARETLLIREDAILTGLESTAMLVLSGECGECCQLLLYCQTVSQLSSSRGRCQRHSSTTAVASGAADPPQQRTVLVLVAPCSRPE